MAGNIFLSAKEALRRYEKNDVRTLKAWARAGEIRYQVIKIGERKNWYFESPEARYARTMGININN